MKGLLTGREVDGALEAPLNRALNARRTAGQSVVRTEQAPSAGAPSESSAVGREVGVVRLNGHTERGPERVLPDHSRTERVVVRREGGQSTRCHGHEVVDCDAEQAVDIRNLGLVVGLE